MRKNKWTLFLDMHSGGSRKEKEELIFVELPEDEAKIFFQNRFGHNPERVTCTCCGNDYSITESDSLEESSGFHRGATYTYFKNGKKITEEEGWKCGFGNNKGVTTKYIGGESMSKFKKRKDVLIINKKDIKKSELIGELKPQGYIWMD